MMSNFQLSEQADPNKIFLVKRSELEGRLDPDYYRQFYKEIENTLNNSKYEIKSIADISENIFQGVSRKLTTNTTYTLLKVKNIAKNNKIKFNNIEYVSLENESKILKAKDIISPFIGEAIKKYKFSVFPQLPKKYVVDNNTGVIRLLPNVNPVFVSTFLMSFYGKQQINRLLGGGGVPFIGTYGIKQIKIPIPPKNIQADIVAKMDKAYQNKQHKEQQAQDLLNSIDVYLLGELGIDLPKKIDNSLKSRIFTKKFSDITGERFDADYHKNIYQVINNNLHHSKYKIKDIASISKKIFQGVSRKLTDNTTYTLLKVKNIAQNDKIKFNDIEFIDLKDENKILKTGDIISPFIGEAIKQYKFSVFTKLSKKYTVDNNTGVIRLLPKNNAIFVSSFLMSFYGKQQINKLLGGGGVPFIGTHGIKQIKIPLPPIEKQNQIAEHISQIRDKAKQLQFEAKTELEQAKNEVETMILGGEV